MPKVLKIDELAGQAAEATQKGKGLTSEQRSNFGATFKEDTERLYSQILSLRKGEKTSSGIEIPKTTVTLRKALQEEYGVTMGQYFNALGISFRSHSFQYMVEKLGITNASLDRTSFKQILTVGNTAQGFNWLIREVFLQLVTDGYEASAQHTDWISGTDSVSSITPIVPKFLHTDDAPTEIQPGETVSFGAMKFGQKTANVIQYGFGLTASDTLLKLWTINMAATFLAKTGRKISLQEDNLVLSTAMNGDQSDGSEAINIVGLHTAGTWDELDFINANAIFDGMGKKITHMIGRRDTINYLKKFLKMNIQLQPTIDNGLNMEFNYKTSARKIAADTVILLDKSSALRKLSFDGGMKLETDRNIRNLTYDIVISGYTGSYVQEPTSRVALQKSLALASYPYPVAMDEQEYVDTLRF